MILVSWNLKKNKLMMLNMDLIFIFNVCCFEYEFLVVLIYNIGKFSSLLVFCILKNYVK